MNSEGNDAGSIAKYAAVATASELAGKAINMLTAKATLYIRLLGLGNHDSSGATTNQDVGALRTLKKGRNKASEKLASRAGEQINQAKLTVEGAKVKATEVETAVSMLASGFMPLRVQYNPTSLKMHTVAGTITQYKGMGDDNMNSVQNTDKKASTYLTVQLIFEDINNSDAFGASTLSEGGASLSNAVDMAKSVAVNTFSDGYSVKKQTEGIMSLLMMKRTRQVIFVWNNMFFHGELISVNINYTMFNKNGHPIKATVDMQIQQTNGNATFKSDMDYWNEVLNTAFVKDSIWSDVGNLVGMPF